MMNSHTWILDKQRSQPMTPYLRLMGLSEMAIEAWSKAEKETETFRVIKMLSVSSDETDAYLKQLTRGIIPSSIPSFKLPDRRINDETEGLVDTVQHNDVRSKTPPVTRQPFGGVWIYKRDRVQNGSEAYLFGVEVISSCKVKNGKRRTIVTSEHKAHLRTQFELPLKNGTTCRLIETLTLVDDGRTMRQNFIATNVSTSKTCAIDRFFNKTASLQLDIHGPEEEENDDEDE